jgi:hypothetical protein
MKYNDFLESLATPEIRKYVKEGISRSYPVVGQNDGKIVDVFFLYSVSLTDGDSAEAPISSLLIDATAKSLIKYEKCNPEKIDNSLNCSSDDYWEADKEYRELYPQIRTFAFSKKISQSQKEILMAFTKVFRTLYNDSFYKLFNDLFNDFFKWMDEEKGD